MRAPWTPCLTSLVSAPDYDANMLTLAKILRNTVIVTPNANSRMTTDTTMRMHPAGKFARDDLDRYATLAASLRRHCLWKQSAL